MGSRKRILWLHTQPEPYHNRMMDDLARGTPYPVPGLGQIPTQFDYIAAFAARGPSWYEENTPRVAQTVFLRPIPGKEQRTPTTREQYHIDWRTDLLPLKFDAAIVAGYAWRTQRELIRHCHANNIPVVLWADSNLRAERNPTLKGRLRRALKKRLLKGILQSVDYVLAANSRGIAYWRYYGMPHDKIDICPYYADYPRIDAALALPRVEILRRYGLAETDRYIFTAARLVPAKGLDLMIPAFLAGNHAARGWKYLIAGVGPLEAELKQRAGDALGKSIHFLGFQQPADNLALIAHADLFAFPSRYEPHGIVVSESLAAGTPVLASNVVGAACDLVDPGVSGFFFRNENLPDLTAKLSQALSNPAALQAMRPGARATFEAWYRRTSPILIVPKIMGDLLHNAGHSTDKVESQAGRS